MGVLSGVHFTHRHIDGVVQDQVEVLMTKQVRLLIIDPQNDFCDLPESWQITNPLSGQRIAPALPVTGAHADMQRLATLIRQAQSAITDIYVTLDSHHRVDIAHPPFG